MFRPFPHKELVDSVKNVKHLIVLDRAISFGGALEGPMAMEILTTLRLRSIDVDLYNYIVGIGQRSVTELDIINIYYHASKLIEKGVRLTESIYWGVRE